MANILDSLKYKLYNMALKAQQATGGGVPVPLNNDPGWKNWDAKAAVNEGYKAAVYVYACIQKKSKAAASVPWYVYKRSGDKWEIVNNHPLEQLIEKPNPFMSRSDLIERLVVNLELAGNSIFKKTLYGSGNIPVELWPMGPDGIEPVPDPEEFIKNYKYKVGREIFTFETNEILHAMYIDPSNVYWGLSPLQVAAKTVDTDIEAVKWNKIALQNRAVTDGVFSFDQPLSQDQWTEARAQVRQQHQGAGNARAPWVLGSGARWNSMSLSPAEMDFIQGRKMTREEICSVFEVPPPIVGILDKANYSNMREARRVFWLDTMIPLLEGLKNVFNRDLTPAFGDPSVYYVDYDVSNVEALQDNFNEKIDGAYKLWTMGIPLNTINQRLELGFDDIPGGDTGFLPASIIPATMAADPEPVAPTTPQPNTPPDPELIPPEGEKRLKKYELKGVNLRTPEQKATYWKSFERQRLNYYKNMQKQAKELFKKEGAAVVAAFKESNGDIKKTMDAIEKSEKTWRKMLMTNYRVISEYFGNQTISGFKSFSGYQKKAEEDPEAEPETPEVNPLAIPEFDPFEADIALYLETTAAAKVTGISETTRNDMRAMITAARTDGATMDEIAEEIKETYLQYGDYRAFRIARTEVVGASNFGSYFGALKASDTLGRDMEKEWVDSGDKRVREAHEKMNGETVPVLDKFSNGLDYPCDMLNGSGKDVIQCRCTMVYNII